MSKCQNCGAEHKAGIHFCTQCGRVLPEANKGVKIDPENVQKAFQSFAKGDFFGAAFSGKPKTFRPVNETRPQTAPLSSSDSTRRGRSAARADVIRTVARAVAIGIAKSVALSIAVLGPGFVMLTMGLLVPGMIWLFVGSFAMMAWTYRKPWRLGLIACVIPPAAAAICYAVQLMIFGGAAPPLLFLGGAILAGLAVGFWRARTHGVKQAEDGGIVAERTIGYLLVWVAAYVATQLLGLFAVSTLAVRAGLLSGAFTTAMLAVVSIVVWAKFRRLKLAPAVMVLSVLAGLGVTGAPSEVWAEEAMRAQLRAHLNGMAAVPTALRAQIPVDVEYRAGLVTNKKVGTLDGAEATYGFGRVSDQLLLNVRIGVYKATSGTVESYLQAELDAWKASGLRVNQGVVILAGGGGQFTTYDIRPSDNVVSMVGVYNGRFLYAEAGGALSKPGNPQLIPVSSVLPGLAATAIRFAAGDPVDGAPAATNPVRPSGQTVQPPIDSPDTDTRLDVPGTVSIVQDDPFEPMTPEEIAAASTAVAAVLVAAGVAASVAQAIAVAIANALQAGVQLSAEEIQQAIADALMDMLGRGGDTAVAETGNAPPNVSFTDRFREPQSEPKPETKPETEPQPRQEPQAETPPPAAEPERPRVAEPESPSPARPAEPGESHKSQDEPTYKPRGPYRDPTLAVPGVDNSATGWWVNAITEFSGGAIDDSWELMTKGPGALWDAGISAMTTAGNTLTNRENWEIGLDALSETGRDIAGLTSGNIDTFGKVAGNLQSGGETAAKISGHLLDQAWKDPSGAAVAVARTVLGAENWEKAVDPNVPVTERVGRAIWGVVDTGGTLVGMAGTAASGANKLAGLLRTADSASDAATALKAADKLGDAASAARAADASADAVAAARVLDDAEEAATAARTADTAAEAARAGNAATDSAAAARLAEEGDDAAAAARTLEAAGDTGKAEQAAAKTSEATREAGRLARETDAPGPQNLDELREQLANQKSGWTERGDDFVPGKNTEAFVPQKERPKVDGLPDFREDAAGYVRDLPQGVLVDRNLVTAGTGWTGHQIDDMARFSKAENVTVGARTTNLESMRHIRDGKAVPKPLDIKSKTIGELDVYLGAKSEDKGLVGYFRPKEPNMSDVPDKLQQAVKDRHKLRMDEYNDLRKDMNKLVSEGKVVQKDGKLHAVIKDSAGNTKHVPYAGDIDGVYFRDNATGQLVPPGPEYDRLKTAWMGGDKSKGVPNYWTGSNAPGQHGVESNLVADISRQYPQGSSEYDEALKKARKLHAKLGDSYPKEVIVEVDAAGNIRRGLHLSPESQPLPDLTPVR